MFCYQECCDNALEKYSNYFKYKFGDSINFSRSNIFLMKKFYLSFPIYYDRLNELDWDVYKELLKISNDKKKYFYFYLCLLFNYSISDLNSCINNNLYERI